MSSGRVGTRLIAVIEAIKGALVLLAGFGILGLAGEEPQFTAEQIVQQFHLNPASRIPRIFVAAADSASDTKLWLLAGAAFLYGALRLVEAVGLWRQLRWAEWIGFVSATLYIPIELYEIARGITGVKLLVLGANVFCVMILARALDGRRQHRST